MAKRHKQDWQNYLFCEIWEIWFCEIWETWKMKVPCADFTDFTRFDTCN